ncbi:MAG: c-type cytochrome, partial [Cyclobacteriaceae bacterium]|nr:c-type cytochrome [Cyclobacteriaceae bacterium]
MLLGIVWDYKLPSNTLRFNFHQPTLQMTISFYSAQCNQIKRIISIVVLTVFLFSCSENKKGQDQYTTWDHYLGDPALTHYSSLDQINRDNVSGLTVAWEYHSGGASPNTVLQTNPLIKDTILYGASPELGIFALHAATGKEIWSSRPLDYNGIVRGFMYWEDGADKRIIVGLSNFLVAFNALDGTLAEGFGDKGMLDLKGGLGRDVSAVRLDITTPGVIYNDLIIQGFRTNESHPSIPGHIRAFDVRTGEQKWIFHTIPHPGEAGYETWPENAWLYSGGANNWCGMALDEEKGIVFVPTGSAAFDFWGGDRKGSNLYANSIIALNAVTGERLWHFQTVHHDIWDLDLPSPPTLVTIRKDGKTIEAVAQMGKTGYVFLFDRVTGEPVYDIEERPVPPSDLFGEEAYPTQPFPVKPPQFSKSVLTEADINPLAANRDSILEVLRSLKNEGQFYPPSLEGTVVYPGFSGGGEWGGAGYDPETGILYINSNEVPCVMKMIDIRDKPAASLYAQGKKVYQTYCMGCHGKELQGSTQFGNAMSLVNLKARLTSDSVKQVINLGRNLMPSFGFLTDAEKIAATAYLLEDTLSEPIAGAGGVITSPYSFEGYTRFNDADGFPVTNPPWARLNAIDLNKGEILWQVPLGSYEELAEKGMTNTGTRNYGGMVITAG